MTRPNRVVYPGFPHHVTQRGNRRQETFRDDQDRLTFIKLLAACMKSYGLAMWAYALMVNHIHLIVVPATIHSLSAVMRDLLSDYALAFNKRYGYTGHLWQERFYSTVLGPGHLWNAVRYVERNPVRAGIVGRAEDYQWSSAAFHCGLQSTDPLVSTDSPLIRAIDDWSGWLHIPDDEREMELLRHNTRKGRVCGPPEFLKTLEKALGRPILPQKPGPKSAG